MAEATILSTIAAEVARRGLCRLTIGHIAALAGVGRSTVKNAVRQAAALGILTSEGWRLVGATCVGAERAHPGRSVS